MESVKEIFTTLQLQSLLTYGFWDLLVNILMYAALATPTFLLFWVIFKDTFQKRRIQQKKNNYTLGMHREIKNSVVSLVIFTGVDILIYFAQLKGHTKIYNSVDAYGWPYLVFSVVVIMVLHDAWFYFVHRLMHHPKIYRHVHLVHHQSTDPSPFAAFSFHPIEAFLEAAVYIVFAFLLPVHLVALWTWQFIQLTLNVIAHLGYEVYPKNFNTHWLFKFKTPSTHHNMHHARFKGNYGLYFTWWDRIFKTEFEDYHKTYEEIQQRVEDAETLQPFPPEVSIHVLLDAKAQLYPVARKAS